MMAILQKLLKTVYMIRAELPLFKSVLMEKFGYISFQLVFANLDAIGIQIKSSGEIVVITYRGKSKVGFIYDYGNLPEDRVIDIYKDAPEDFNDIAAYEKALEDKIDILHMPRDNYFFVSDREAVTIKRR